MSEKKRCLNCMKEYDSVYEICPHCGHVDNTPPGEIYFLMPGTVLQNRFVIGTTVGAGGFGIVYKAWDRTLDKVVAIKEFFPVGFVSRSTGQSALSIIPSRKEEFEKEKFRFLEEARYLAKFSEHPNIVNVYSFFEENNTAYINMEFLEGKSLKSHIDELGGKMAVNDAVNVTVLILKALKDIHKEKIIHRDVSPDNIFVCDGGNIKLMDFGAARFSKEDASGYTMILKPGYAPPEQYQSNSKQGAYTDIYAVGAVLYRAVTGYKAPESTNRMEGEKMVEPIDLNSGVSPTLNNVIMRAMALAPELRFQTDDEFISALSSPKALKIRSVDEELKHRRLKRAIRVVCGLIVLCVGGVVAGSLFNAGKAQIDLEPADITLWACMPEYTEDVTETEYAAFITKALEEYTEKYAEAGVNVTVTAFRQEEYGEKLAEAQLNGSMPDIYTTPDEGNFHSADLERLFSYIKSSDYVGLNSVETLYGNRTVCPITFSMAVVYYNTTMEGYDESSALDEYRKNIEDGIYDVNYGQVEEFVNEKIPYVVADTSCYWQIQKKLGGKYKIVTIPGEEKTAATYQMVFSINDDISDADKNASIQLLFYLLGERAQAVLCIEKHQQLPLQKNIYERYTGLNVEFQDLEDAYKNMQFMR